jgi:hypothetical protein
VEGTAKMISKQTPRNIKTKLRWHYLRLDTGRRLMVTHEWWNAFLKSLQRELVNPLPKN